MRAKITSMKNSESLRGCVLISHKYTLCNMTDEN